MRARLRGILVTALCAGCGGAGPSSGPSTTSSSLSGRVLSRATRLAVDSARAEILDGPEAGRSADTDNEGRFRLDRLTGGRFTLRVTHSLFQPEDQAVAAMGEASVVFLLKRKTCEVSSCGRAIGPCNEPLGLLRPPFSASRRTSNQFDHHYPFGFSGPDDGVFQNYCGAPASYDSHDGYDWLMPHGTEVLAAADGTVSFAGAEPAFFCPFLGRVVAGNVVLVDHTARSGEGYRTVYRHLDDVAVTGGQRVSAGDAIGSSGNTGCSTGPHLHFGVYRQFGNAGDLVPVDPYGWQGAGDDPWSVEPHGGFSAWLWIDAPVLGLSSDVIRDAHSPGF
jgi:Peptidase family M23